MRKKIVTVVKKDAKYLFLSGAVSLVLAFPNLRGAFAGSAPPFRPLALSALLFLLLYLALRLFAATVSRHIGLERAHLETAEVNRVALFLFVAYKEAVKAIFGVSLTLAWMAGVLFILETFASHFFLVPVVLGLLYSALLFLLVFSFAAFLDLFRYPFRR